jgi:hypothetical protein
LWGVDLRRTRSPSQTPPRAAILGALVDIRTSGYLHWKACLNEGVSAKATRDLPLVQGSDEEFIYSRFPRESRELAGSNVVVQLQPGQEGTLKAHATSRKTPCQTCSCQTCSCQTCRSAYGCARHGGRGPQIPAPTAQGNNKASRGCHRPRSHP